MKNLRKMYRRAMYGSAVLLGAILGTYLGAQQYEACGPNDNATSQSSLECVVNDVVKCTANGYRCNNDYGWGVDSEVGHACCEYEENYRHYCCRISLRTYLCKKVEAGCVR